MKNINFLYSVNSLLAYKINEEFYGGNHYVWCAPEFNCTENPPSSNPKEIMKMIWADVNLHDRHSPKIMQNKLGLLNGVEINYKNNNISEEQREELIKIVNGVDIAYFRPLIYIISYQKVKNKIIKVSATEKAEWFSNEYKIECLKSKEFDMIDIYR